MEGLTNVSSLFGGCESLTSVPEGLFTKCKRITNVNHVFSRLKLETIPDKIFYGLDELEYANMAFYATDITEIPKGMFANKRSLREVSNCFRSCKKLKSVPDGLFDDCINL